MNPDKRLISLEPSKPSSSQLRSEFISSLHFLVWKRPSLVAGLILSCICAVLYAIRTWIDYVAVPFSVYFNAFHLACDGRRSSDGVAFRRNINYGDVFNENADMLEPKDCEQVPASQRKYILYVHGGGFVSVHRAVLNHSMTPLVRAGFTVFSIDYPLAPMYRYPTAIISVLKALAFLRLEYGVQSVQIIGDSAGGNLVSMAAGILSNPDGEWDARIRDFVAVNSLPTIESVSLMYSICDRDSWADRSDNSVLNTVMSGVLQVCLGLYQSSEDDKVTVACNFDKIVFFPPTFLLCGNTDLLSYSHDVFEAHLQSISVPVRSVVTKGFHGYHGLPVPFSFGLWRTTVFPATCELIRWLTKDDESRVPVLPPRSVFEYDVHLLIILFVLHVIPFLWIFS